jgi:hypothetical protein
MEELMSSPRSGISDIQSLNSTLADIVSWSVIAKQGINKNPEILETPASSKISEWMRNIRYEDYDKMIKILDKALNKKTLPTIQNVLSTAVKEADLPIWRKNAFSVYIDKFKYYVEQTERYGGWEGFLSEAFDPEKNEFELMTPENIQNTTDHNQVECWTEDVCLLEHMGKFER